MKFSKAQQNGGLNLLIIHAQIRLVAAVGQSLLGALDLVFALRTVHAHETGLAVVAGGQRNGGDDLDPLEEGVVRRVAEQFE